MQRPRHRWEDIVKMNLKERGWQGMDWIHLVHNRDKQPGLVTMVVILQVH